MRRKKDNFKFIYFIFLTLLVIVAIAAILYVRSLLNQYEEAQPDKRVAEAVEILKSDAESGTLASKYQIGEITPGKFEAGFDVLERYKSLICSDELTFAPKAGVLAEDTMTYLVKNGGFTLAEVGLAATSELKTKLAVFSYRDWEVTYVKPLLEPTDYILSVPSYFTVKVNGTTLTEADGTAVSDGIDYKLGGIYLKPDLVITDPDGNVAEYKVKDNKIIPVFFNYSLTLPSTLKVELNGEDHPGLPLADDGRISHDIRVLTEPKVVIRDLYGNEVEYKGENDIPLTYVRITATSDHKVKVDGADVPAEAVSETVNQDFTYLTDYVEGLPALKEYDVAVLKKDTDVSVTDKNGSPVKIDVASHRADLSAVSTGSGTIPTDVSSLVNPLDILEKWSLFMSNDLPFYEVAQYMIPSSYQYEVGTKYANGIDITFTSIHTLATPPFSNEKVGNFTWITDKCFSVDVSFEKTMLLSDGQTLVDAMNERMYFAMYDDTEDWTDNPTWKLVSMKEIVTDAE